MEQEDQAERSHTRDEEHEDFQIQVGEEAKLAEAQSEEDEVGLRVIKARWKDSCQGSRSSGESRNSCPRLQVRLSQYENIPLYSQNSHIRGEGKKKRPRTYQKSTNGKLRKKASLRCSFSMRFKDFCLSRVTLHGSEMLDQCFSFLVLLILLYCCFFSYM